MAVASIAQKAATATAITQEPYRIKSSLYCSHEVTPARERVRAESSGTRNGSNNRGAIAIVKPQTWLDYLLTDRSQFDILVFDPGWWGIGCHSINYIGAISSRCSAVRLRGRSRRARSSPSGCGASAC